MSEPALPATTTGVAVKVCGLTRPADAALAARLGALALGVVLAPSPRRVDLALATAVFEAAPPDLARIGVFVDPEPGFVAEAVRACDLDWVQLSGTESPALARAVLASARTGATGDRARPGLLKAVHVRTADDLAGLAEYPADAFLLDAPVTDGRMGGTGRSFDWAAAAGLTVHRRRIALAGGLTAANLAAAVVAVRPTMVDVSSGVETTPGIKDPARLSAFMEAARRIEREGSPCGQ